MMTAMIALSYAFDTAICQMDTIHHRKTLCFLYSPLDQSIGVYANRRARNDRSCIHLTTKGDSMQLKDNVAIIIGAGQSEGSTAAVGNGRATALVLAREGAKVL